MRLRAICYDCKFFRWDSIEPVCDAFPEGIPTKILKSEHMHTEPFRGDNGIRFEPLIDIGEEQND
tara:strand:- start:107 stop:301 length:195 start_codon:yes stop_codon:yes gene_type:complete